MALSKNYHIVAMPFSSKGPSLLFNLNEKVEIKTQYAIASSKVFYVKIDAAPVFRYFISFLKH